MQHRAAGSERHVNTKGADISEELNKKSFSLFKAHPSKEWVEPIVTSRSI
jgi:hypothetical protein